MFDTPLPREKLENILTSLRRGLEELLGDQLEAIYLYGSQARRDARPDSDIDVLVILNGDFDYWEMINRTGNLVASLSLENDTVISLAFVSIEEYNLKNTPFLMNVRREGVSI